MIEKLKIHKLKILGGVLGILVFAGAVFGGCKLGQKQIQPTPIVIATPTLDPTATWETYTHKNYNFEFKYPQSWRIRAEGQMFEKGDATVFTELGPRQKEATSLSDGIIVGVAIPVSDEDLPLGEWVRKHNLQPTYDLYGKYPNLEDTNVAGIKALKTSMCGIACADYYHIRKGDLVYQIGVSIMGPEKERHQKNFNLMLSTFRFLE